MNNTPIYVAIDLRGIDASLSPHQIQFHGWFNPHNPCISCSMIPSTVEIT